MKCAWRCSATSCLHRRRNTTSHRPTRRRWSSSTATWAQTLDDIDFHKGREPTTIMLRLRKLFQRAQPDARELRVLHGILADAQRMAELAKGR